MVNDDILIKTERERGHREDWPDLVIAMKERITEMKLGFPGIGNDHLTLLPFSGIRRGDIFIWDKYTESLTRNGDEAPLMLRDLGNNQFFVEGIGVGVDSVRDPERLKFRWKDTVKIDEIDPDSLVFRVDVRPTLNGGPGYYYFYKSYRDFRL